MDEGGKKNIKGCRKPQNTTLLRPPPEQLLQRLMVSIVLRDDVREELSCQKKKTTRDEKPEITNIVIIRQN